MKKNFKLLSYAISLVLTGCGTVELPSNVEVAGDVLGNVRYSYTPAVEFDKVKRCIALNIKNENVKLSDSSGTFVGRYSGNLYEIGSSTTDFAPQTLVTLDEFHRYIVVNGSTGYYFLSSGFTIRYRLQVQTRPDYGVTILFDNITRAQNSTGLASNSGFRPIYTHYGAGADKVVHELDIVKNDLTNCFSQ